MNPALAALLIAAGLSASLAMLVFALIGTTGESRPPSRLSRYLRAALSGTGGSAARITHRTTLVAGLVTGIVVWVVSGVAAAGLIAVIVVPGVPWLLAVGRDAVRTIERLTAVEAWTRYLSGRVAVGVGLLQAIVATARTAPPLIAPQVRELASRLQAGWPPRRALLAFADDLDDNASDQVVAVLIGHLNERGEKLASILDSIADVIAAEIVKRRDVYSKRAEPRLVTRFLTGLTVVLIAAGFALPAYTRPYQTITGQVLLCLFTALGIGIMRWIRALGRSGRAPRLLLGHPAGTPDGAS